MKQAKLQWLQDLSEINGDNLNNIRREANGHFRNKKKEYLKDKINELAMNDNNTNTADLHRKTNEFMRGYQPRSNLVKEENGDLLADSHNILIKQKNCSQLLNVLRVSDVTQREIHIAEPLEPDPSSCEAEIAIAQLRNDKLPGTDSSRKRNIIV
jgi:hypothetical protein